MQNITKSNTDTNIPLSYDNNQLHQLALQITKTITYQKSLAKSVDNLIHKMEYQFDKLDDRLHLLEKNEFSRQEKSKLIWNIFQSSPKYVLTLALTLIAGGTIGGNLIHHGVSYLIKYISGIM